MEVELWILKSNGTHFTKVGTGITDANGNFVSLVEPPAGWER